jgi:hypothetical protein
MSGGGLERNIATTAYDSELFSTAIHRHHHLDEFPFDDVLRSFHLQLLFIIFFIIIIFIVVIIDTETWINNKKNAIFHRKEAHKFNFTTFTFSCFCVRFSVSTLNQKDT